MRAVLATLIACAAFAAAGVANVSAVVSCDPCGGGGSVPPKTLTVTVSGQGSVSDGIAASGTCARAQSPCSMSYSYNHAATFTATPATGWHLDHWVGCSGTTTCDVVMDTNKSLGAVFAPDTPVITAPAADSTVLSTNGGLVSVSWTGGTATNQHAQCSTTGTSWADCYSGITAGPYETGTPPTLYVRAIDSDGNPSAPASRSFRLVNVPDTSIGGTPAAGATVASASTAFTYSASFAYVGTNPDPTFQCMLDGSSVPCSDNFGPLADGAHTLSVRAAVTPFGDNVSYADATPATRTWTVDTTGPTASITTGPSEGSSTVETAADFRFTKTEGTFQCSLDVAAFAACPGPAADQASYTGLALGSHTFRVRAVDSLGNAGTAATRSWVVAAPPAPSSSAGPASETPPGPGAGAGAGAETPSSPVVQKIQVVLASKWLSTRKGTKAVKLALSSIPTGATIVVSCESTTNGCPFKSKSLTPKAGKANLLALLKKRLLKKGAVLEIRVTKAGMTGQLLRFTMRPPKQPEKASISS
jgi:hypothetical protein